MKKTQQQKIKTNILYLLILTVFCTIASAQTQKIIPQNFSTQLAQYTSQTEQKPLISSKSFIDWTRQEFVSDVLFNVEKAGIPLPSGKNTAIDRISLELPGMIKDPLLSLSVDSQQKLGDVVLDENITLEELTQIIQDGKKSPGYFENSTTVIKTDHSIDLTTISSLMVKHKTPYTPDNPIERVPTRKYTGIIIDARGELPVHGEFLKDKAIPCFFPKIWDEEMNLIYERNMVDRENAIQNGIVHYNYSDNENLYEDRIGIDPLHIIAKKIYGQNRTDLLISRNDALKILVQPENLQLLRDGKIVILLNKENLIYDVTIPRKDKFYYTAFNTVHQLLNIEKIPKVSIKDTYKGILFQVDLKFYPDSPILLPEEDERIEKIANILLEITKTNEFTILVEGHAADVGKPQGELNLSLERAKSVTEALQNCGLPHDLFNFKGLGSSQPIAPNTTAEGRAQNRRVDITARPKATYIQRDFY